MGLFDLFSNDTAEQAAQQRNAGLQQGYDALSGLYEKGRTDVGNTYGNAANMYSNLINNYGTTLGSYGAGANAYGDASGANGAAGLQRATDNFKNSGQYGAYGFALDQGLQALDRTHAASGNLASGNADADTLKYATGLAGQQYGNYVAGLQPYLSANTTALGGLGNATAGAAGVNTGLGNTLNASYQGQGTAANANYTGQGASNAAATMNNYQVGNNILSGISTAAKLGSSLFGAFG